MADAVDEVMIGGGGEIYREALPLADRLYITHVDAAPDGDAVFPVIDATIWEVVEEPESSAPNATVPDSASKCTKGETPPNVDPQGGVPYIGRNYLSAEG
jgi:dihydrofolate reductase